MGAPEYVPMKRLLAALVTLACAAVGSATIQQGLRSDVPALKARAEFLD